MMMYAVTYRSSQNALPTSASRRDGLGMTNFIFMRRDVTNYARGIFLIRIKKVFLDIQ